MRGVQLVAVTSPDANHTVGVASLPCLYINSSGSVSLSAMRVETSQVQLSKVRKTRGGNRNEASSQAGAAAELLKSAQTKPTSSQRTCVLNDYSSAPRSPHLSRLVETFPCALPTVAPSLLNTRHGVELGVFTERRRAQCLR